LNHETGQTPSRLAATVAIPLLTMYGCKQRERSRVAGKAKAGALLRSGTLDGLHVGKGTGAGSVGRAQHAAAVAAPTFVKLILSSHDRDLWRWWG
jgi:hypothetical protein